MFDPTIQALQHHAQSKYPRLNLLSDGTPRDVRLVPIKQTKFALTYLALLVDYNLRMLARHAEKIDANITVVRPVTTPSTHHGFRAPH